MPPTPPRSTLTPLSKQLCFFNSFFCCCFKFTESICVTLESGQPTSVATLLEKIDWLFPRNCQIPIAPQLWWDFMLVSPLPGWMFVWLEPEEGMRLCGSRACCLGGCEFIWASALLCLEDSVFLKSSLPLDLTILLPSSGKFPKPCWGGVWYIHPFF